MVTRSSYGKARHTHPMQDLTQVSVLCDGSVHHDNVHQSIEASVTISTAP